MTLKTLPWPNFSNQKAISLNGAQSIELPPSNKLELEKNFTISLWVKLNESMQKDTRIFTFHRESFATTNLGIGISVNKLKLIYSTQLKEVKSKSVSVNLFDNQWHQIVLVKRNKKLTVFVDTKKTLTLVQELSLFGNHPAFLGAYSGIQKGIIAKIDEFAIFGKAFSYQQILELNNNNFSMDLSEHSMVKHLKTWYQLGDQNQDSTNSITDVIGGKNATPINLSAKDFIRDSP
jgi:hypothetical protein